MTRAVFLLFFFNVSLALFAQRQIDIEKVVVGEISFLGNKVTKNKIIARELEFSKGDTLSTTELDRLIELSRQNMRNLSIFNFVEVEKTAIQIPDGIKMNIQFIFTECWYLLPYPKIEFADRNFNSWYETSNWKRVSIGGDIKHNNFRGRLEQLNLTLYFGYNQQFGIAYQIPYLTKKQNFGIGFDFAYIRKREVAYETENDKPNYYFLSNKIAQKSIRVGGKLLYRYGFRNLHTLYLSWNSDRFNDSVFVLNPDFMHRPDKKNDYFTASYVFRNDYRDDKPYPLKGHYLELELTKIGLGILTSEPNFFYAKTTADWYHHLGGRWYWASNLTAKISDGNKQPYYLMQGLGFGNDFVRSYELYVVDGKSYGLNKNNLKYNIVKPKVRKMNFLKSEKFSKIHYALYGNLFFDAAYVVNSDKKQHSRLQNKLIYGGGIGFDVVTYYDLVFRFEYAINMFGNGGLYIHFVAPISE
ncbi:MAG: hypothetical protein LBM67_02870 [Lentimicrobiaceae bacterium]|jgi:outer membrane protein assembly factor BamA|nr:hypothetical protein [Lentimicrobiaceae bacterium]